MEILSQQEEPPPPPPPPEVEEPVMAQHSSRDGGGGGGARVDLRKLESRRSVERIIEEWKKQIDQVKRKLYFFVCERLWHQIN